jgi:hypothetical protein
MSKYVSVVSRKKGHGLKHIKTHLVLHVSDDILWFGSPNNWNSACLESGNKFHAKSPAQLKQLQNDQLEDQVCAQTTNLLALSMARDLIWKLKESLPNEPTINESLTPSATIALDSQARNGGTCFLVIVTEQGKWLLVN